MSFGPVTLGLSSTSDVSAPGAVRILSITQTSNSALVLKCELPTLDSDGSALTGLTKLTVAEALATVDGVNPFENLSMESAIGLADATTNIELAADAAGTIVDVTVPILTVGAVHAFAVAASD